MKKDIQALKKEYLEYLEINKNRSYLTIKNYTTWIDVFIRETNIRSLKNVNLKVTEEFARTMKNKGISYRTINYYLIAMRCFIGHYRERGYKIINPKLIELIQVPQTKITLPTKKEIEMLFSAELPIREKTMLEFLFSTGLRIKEFQSLKIEDIDFENNKISVIGKGKKIRLVFFSETTAKFLKKFIQEKKHGKLFELSTRSIQKIMKKIAKIAGITSDITPHMIRHMFATNMLQRGANIHSVQKILGHTSVATTEKYLHVSDSHLQEEHTKYARL